MLKENLEQTKEERYYLFEVIYVNLPQIDTFQRQRRKGLSSSSESSTKGSKKRLNSSVDLTSCFI